MSQRFLIPTNLFYHWQDPNPKEGNNFPPPNTGDIYFNIISRTLRVFYEGTWHDAGGAGGGGGGTNEVEIQATPPDEQSVELWIDTDAPAASFDHGDLSGLSDDDHPQYLPRAEYTPPIVSDNPASGTYPANTVWIEY